MRTVVKTSLRQIGNTSLLCLIPLLCCLLTCSIASAEQVRKVLVINSYHSGNSWTDNITKGIRSVFSDEMQEALIYVEYMDSKRFAKSDVFGLLEQHYSKKYGNFKFDVIIVSDDNALEFLLERRAMLFPGVPVVFCGINDFRESMLTGQENITGIVEDFDLKGTIELILKLHPKIKRIAAVSDVVPTGKLHLQHFRKTISLFDGRGVEFVELSELTPDELRAAFKKLPDDSALIELSYYRDPTGATYTVSESTALLTESGLPIYSCWEIFLGKGIVGGILTNGQMHGKHAAKLAVRILRGESVSDIPVMTNGPNVPMFDYNLLERFGIPLSCLPEGSIVINEPRSFYHQYRYRIWFSLALFLLLAAINIFLIMNIGMRRRAEKALKESEKRFRTVVKHSPLAILIENDNGDIEYINDKHIGIFGYSPEEIPTIDKWRGKAYPDDDYRERVKAEWAARMAAKPDVGEEVDPIEWEITCKDGSVRVVEVRYTPLEGRGLIIFADITRRTIAEEKRKSLEAQILHVQKLESLGILAGGIAHDFNNLLVGVLGNTELAKRKLKPESPIVPYLKKIESASVRLADLTNQMLAYSGKGKFVVEPINLSSLVEEMSNLLHISISKKTVLKYNFSSVPPVIKADATQLRQVVMNLITNASEAIQDKSGVISISTGIMAVDKAYFSDTYLDVGFQDGTYAYVEVSDTGCGMDEETKAKVFDPFFTTKSTGRGLGLAAVVGIVRSHDGAIKVYSEVGRGTTIKVIFPYIGLTETSRDRQAEGKSKWHSGGTILAVDDEDTVRSVVKLTLEQEGFSVILAADGQEATKIFEERQDEIDAVLLDLTMPHKGGEDTYRDMRRISPDVSVVLMSGYSEQDATDRFNGKGLAGFIQKPFRANTLLESLQKIWSHREKKRGE